MQGITVHINILYIFVYYLNNYKIYTINIKSLFIFWNFSDNEQLIKSKDFLKSKLEASEIKESDLITQIKKYADLVEHIELEKNQAVLEKDQYAQEKMNSDQKIEEFLREFQENLNKEKRQVVENVNEEIEQLNGTIKELETKAFKQESTIDKLTRDKIGLISELESCKKKCNSIDLDTHQVIF